MKWILLITFPTWINMMVRTYAWRGILQDDGIINKFFGLFGLGPVPMLNTGFDVVLGMVYNFLPFMIIQIYTSLAKLDTSLLEAAADLGANKTKSFLRITLPLSIPGVLSGITLVFLPAVSSFYIPEMLGGGRYYMIGNLIETQFLTTENWNFGSAVSLIMVIIIIVSMYFTGKADKTEIMEQRGN
jgi:spermidine/putrescine transport system permease protein